MQPSGGLVILIALGDDVGMMDACSPYQLGRYFLCNTDSTVVETCEAGSFELRHRSGGGLGISMVQST